MWICHEGKVPCRATCSVHMYGHKLRAKGATAVGTYALGRIRKLREGKREGRGKEKEMGMGKWLLAHGSRLKAHSRSR